MNSDGCATVHVEEQKALETLTVLGNPFTEKLVLKVNAARPGDWEIRLVNTLGVTVASRKAAANEVVEMETSGLAAGVYVVLASQDALQIAKRVVKM